MKPRTEALLRLFAVQASYTYERMLGIGVGHASAPLLRDVLSARSARARHEAVARSADFFNSHPYLASIAVGAEVKAEQEGASGEVITRLRRALSGPLGALGDQLVWAGWVPALIGIALAAASWVGIWVIPVVVVLHNVLRFRVMSWGLDLGLREGLGVGGALHRSWLPRVAEDAQRVAAFSIGLAVPIVAWHILASASRGDAEVTVALGVLGVTFALFPATRTRVTGLRYGLALLAACLVVVWGST